jgi:hypothetical protein
VTFEFSQTRDPRNNGSSIDRGQLPMLYFKRASDVAKARTAALRPGAAEGEEDSGASDAASLASVDLKALTSGLNGDGASALLAIAEWALGRLEGHPAADTAAESESAAGFALAFAAALVRTRGRGAARAWRGAAAALLAAAAAERDRRSAVERHDGERRNRGARRARVRTG